MLFNSRNTTCLRVFVILILLLLTSCSLGRRTTEPRLGTAEEYYNRSIWHILRQEYNQAIDDASESINLDPTYVNAYYVRGTAYASQDKHDQAIRDFTDAINLKYNYIDAYKQRASSYIAQGNTEGAIVDYNIIIKLQPDDPDAFYRRGIAYKEIGDNNRAIADFKEAWILNKDSELGTKIEAELIKFEINPISITQVPELVQSPIPNATVTAPIILNIPSNFRDMFTGRISFITETSQRDSLTSEFTTNFDFHTLDLQSGELTNVTDDIKSLDSNYYWSPDGSKVAVISAYGSNQDTQLGQASHSNIFIINADGTGAINVTNRPAFYSAPSWSPDSTRLVFASDPEKRAYNSLYIAYADGSKIISIKQSSDAIVDPIWSPNGRYILFKSSPFGPRTKDDLYRIDVDGSNQIKLTNNPASYFNYVWSHDSSQIAYSFNYSDPDHRDKFNQPLGIYVMNADGTNNIRITDESIESYNHVWSPDDKYIAFMRHTPQGYSYEGHLYLMKADGSSVKKLMNEIVDDRFLPTWSPDGQYIAFTIWGTANSDIYTININNPNLINLSESFEKKYKYSPVWGP